MQNQNTQTPIWFQRPKTCVAGNIASLVVQDRFKHTFGVHDQSAAEYANTKGWIVAIATAGAVFGCLGVCHRPSLKQVQISDCGCSAPFSTIDMGGDVLYKVRR